jgi:hypothetical protein
MYLAEAVKLLNGDFKAIVILEVFPGYFASVKGNSIVVAVNHKIHYGAYKGAGRLNSGGFLQSQPLANSIRPTAPHQLSLIDFSFRG